MYSEEFLNELRQAETQLSFEAFDLDDAYKLGTKIRNKAVKTPLSVAVKIVLDGLIVYQTFLPGTGKENDYWMNLKYATVMRAHQSSLRAAAEREVYGIREPWQRDEKNYVFCGGGVPIIVNGVHIGAVVVSGLPHLQDHALAMETMQEYLQEKARGAKEDIPFLP